jgi:hypothetical protein
MMMMILMTKLGQMILHQKMIVGFFVYFLVGLERVVFLEIEAEFDLEMEQYLVMMSFFFFFLFF